MNCEWIETCPFFNDNMDSKAVEMLKEAYCRGNQDACARHMIAKEVGYKYVPLTLYPNQIHQVPSIVKKALESNDE